MPSIPALMYDLPRNPVISVGLPIILGVGSSALVHGSAKSGFWYNSLRAPSGTAPPETYKIVWPILYAGMGFSAHLIIKTFDSSLNPAALDTAKDCLNLYWTQLGLNLLWSPLFFGLKNPLLALVDIGALTGVVGALTLKAHDLPTEINTSFFLVPYLGFTAYAAYINFGYVWNEFRGKKEL